MFPIHIGQKFYSFEELQATIREVENTNYIKYYIRDSRKIENARSKVKHEINPELVYYELKYNCIHGGRFTTQGTGKRNTRTFRVDCPGFISVRASPDGQTLVVKDFNNDHNHTVSKALFDSLPRKRKLSEDAQKYAKEMLLMKVDRKLLQHELLEKTGKVVTNRDLTNLISSCKRKTDDHMEKLVAFKERHNADLEILKKQSDEFQALFFQTMHMKLTVEAFPEFMAIDGTCRLLPLDLQMYVILAEDCNCESEIVAIGIFSIADDSTLDWFFSTFQNKNAAVLNTSLVMIDRNMADVNVVKTYFPIANILPCVFHTLDTFNKEITSSNFSITVSQRMPCLSILKKMVMSTSDEEFNLHLQTFDSLAPSSVKEYYYQNWHDRKDDWFMGSDPHKLSFISSVDNKVETINNKLTCVIRKSSSLIELVEKLFMLIHNWENKYRQTLAQMVQKRPIILPVLGGTNIQYSEILTPNAVAHVEKQMTVVSKSQYLFKVLEPDRYELTTSKGILEVTPTLCTCSFFTSMLMPCHHIFAIRKGTGYPLCDENLCNQRWKKDYVSSFQEKLTHAANASQRNNVDDDSVVSLSTSLDIKRLRKEREEVTKVTNDIANIVCLMNRGKFENSLKILTDLKSYLEQGEDVEITKKIQVPGNSSKKGNKIKSNIIFVDHDHNVLASPHSVIPENENSENSNDIFKNISSNSEVGYATNIVSCNKRESTCSETSNNLLIVPSDIGLVASVETISKE